MHLLSLANELLLLIAENLGDLKHLYSFLRTNRRLAILLTSYFHNLVAKSGHALTALFYSAATKNEAMLRVLLEKGPHMLIKNEDKTVLHSAPAKCNDTVVREISDKVAVIFVRKRQGRYRSYEGPALCWAARIGHDAMVRLLLKNGANIVATDRNEHTPLHHASTMGHSVVVSTLLEMGADMFLKDRFGNTPVRRAAHKDPKHREVLKRLLGHSDVSKPLLGNMMPLHLAAEYLDDDVSVFKSLLQRGADISHRIKSSTTATEETALHIAARAGNREVVRLLLDEGAVVDGHGLYSPIDCAISTGQFEIARLLVERAPIDFRDIKKRSLLHLAIHILQARGSKQAIPWDVEERDEFVRSVLDRGLDVNAKDRYGSTPLHNAVWFGNLSIVKVLLEYGADINAVDIYSNSVLHSAMTPDALQYVGASHLRSGDIEGVFTLLLDKGFNVNTLNCRDMSILHVAAVYPYIKESLISLLIKRGADTSLRAEKWTALDMAIRWENHNVIRLLRDGKVDVV